VLRELLAQGYRVRALVRKEKLPAGHYEQISGDLRRPGELLAALDGCRYVVHCAALYSFSPSLRREMRSVNVAGTSGLLEAAHLAGAERAIVTSSSAALGASRNGEPLTEADWARSASGSAYHDSKLEQERAAFASRLPVTTLLPTAPVGPGDAKPSPTGRIIVDFARGKMFAKPPRAGGLNLVPVEDVARAHVAALTRGRPRERYILGAQDVTLDQLWAMLALITGRAVPRVRIPNALLFSLALADELRCRFIRNGVPIVPLEGVRMSQHRYYADSSKAMRELDYRPGPIEDALRRAVAWYRAQHYID